MSHDGNIRRQHHLEGSEDRIGNVPRLHNGRPVISIFERQFGSLPIVRDSREYLVHLDQMTYINEQSELNPRLDSILTPRLMQTAHGHQRHPHHPYQDFYLLTYGQFLLHTFLLLHENSHEHYTYFICHGIKRQIEDLSSIVDRFYLDFGNVLIIDYRGFGNSTRKQSERGTYIDVQTAFDRLLTSKEIDRRRIVVYDVSMGVALVTQSASEHIHACILENGFTSFKDAASGKSTLARVLPSKILSVGMRAIDKVCRLRVPVMCLIGSNDRSEPHQETLTSNVQLHTCSIRDNLVHPHPRIYWFHSRFNLRNKSDKRQKTRNRIYY